MLPFPPEAVLNGHIRCQSCYGRLTYRHPQKAEAQDLKGKARRVVSPDEVHPGSLPLHDAGFQHVVRNGLSDVWGKGHQVFTECETKEDQKHK